MDKIEFTDWSQVHRMFSSGEIAIFQHRMVIAPPSRYLGSRNLKKKIQTEKGCNSVKNEDI